MSCFTPVKVKVEGNIVEVLDDSKTEEFEEIERMNNDEKKPRGNDEKKFPKVRVTVEAFEELKQFRKEHKCKSYCEVVSKLLRIYSSVND